MSSGVTPYPDFKSTNSRENFNLFMVVLLKIPVKLMTCAHGQFCLRCVQIFNFFEPTTKVVVLWFDTPKLYILIKNCILNYIIMENYANVSCLPLITG